MTDKLDAIVNDIKEAISSKDNKQTNAYDTTAEVKRVDYETGTAWVHIPGGVDETPIKLTVNASVGDNVQVRVSGGSAWIVGNASAPPTDDATAIKARTVATKAQEVAEDAKETANSVQGIANSAMSTAQDAATLAETVEAIANATNQHFWVHPTSGSVYITTQEQDAYLEAPSGRALVITSNGMLMQEQTTEGGTTTTEYLASFNADGTVLYQNGIIAMTMTSSGINLYDSSGHAVASFSDEITLGFYKQHTTITKVTQEGLSFIIRDGLPTTHATEQGAFKLITSGTGSPIKDITNYSGSSSFTHVLDFEPISNTEIAVLKQISGARAYLSFTAGTASTVENISYDGDKTFTYTPPGHVSGVRYGSFDYYIYAPNGAYVTVGTRANKKIAGRTLTVGSGLIASDSDKVVVGKLNVEDTNDDYAFIVGNGVSTRNNAFTVDWNGNIVADGDVTDGSGNVLANKADTSSLATVASTGDYSDLNNPPTIPTQTSDLTNDSGFITLSDLPDYVIEEGTQSSWEYRKWNSGKVEAWRKISNSAAAGSVWVSPLYYRDLTVSIPSGLFSSAPDVKATSTNNQWWVSYANATTATSLTYRLVKPVSSSQASGVSLYLYGE